MQIQKININRYSSNRTQQPSVKTKASLNFGMKLVFDEQAVRKFAGDENLLFIESVFEGFGDKLALVERFKAVYAKIYEKNRNDFGNLLEPAKFNPRVIPNWDNIEIEPAFRLNKKGHFEAELTDNVNSDVRAKGTTFLTDMDEGLEKALDEAMDDYARKLIYNSLWF